VTVSYCGEEFPVAESAQFHLGREGDLVLDENPYLHRRFLQIAQTGGMWWLHNIGSQISATVADIDGLMQAWLAPGGSLPIVFPRTLVWFTAGPTTYEFELIVDEPSFLPSYNEALDEGATTIGRVSFTPSQRLLLLALAEPLLRNGGRGTSAIPTSAKAAGRLGWPLTKFNRKLDYICQKLAKSGVRGLHGGPARLAVNRRARLVEYALAARLIAQTDLPLLDIPGQDVDDDS
jgi:hypothetical protein